jgi:tRNA pseudouridine55 synthase
VIGPRGIVRIAKPVGLTSFEALAPAKRRLGTRRVGHTGTLDRFASGLLVILVGPYTRLGSLFTALDKLYVARVRFGEETDTLDPEGRVIASAPLPSRESLEAAASRFRGPILQAPPAYSAIHIDGERASDRMRRGNTPVMKERSVNISELEIVSFDGAYARIRVRCSSGTYIRSLARDLALAAGSRARLEELERLEVGPFALAGAILAESLDPTRDLSLLDPALASTLGLAPFRLKSAAVTRFRAGGTISETDMEALEVGDPSSSNHGNPLRAIFSASEAFLGMMELSDGSLHYRFVLGIA